ncbi:MAG TPA: hypothetical protein VGJ15_12805, partial [Pirellulales bacterium]
MTNQIPNSKFEEGTAASVRTKLSGLIDQAGMLVVLAGLIVGCSLGIDGFFALRNVDSLLLAVSTVGMISCTMLFCLASGNFDLSVGTIVPCAGVVTAVVLQRTGNIPLGIVAGLALGGFVGLVNGVIVAKCKINPLITTLATMQIVKGVAFRVSGGSSVAIGQESFCRLGTAAFPVVHAANGSVEFQITLPVWICLACFLLFGLLLQYTTFGRNTL